MNAHLILKPEPFMIVATDGTLMDYRSRAVVLATEGVEEWERWERRAMQFDRLGFDDGLQLPPVADAGEGRLTLSGPSLFRLVAANANQRNDRETEDGPIGRFFPDRIDRERAQHWFNHVLPELLHPGHFPTEPEDFVWAMRETAIRGQLWRAIRANTIAPSSTMSG